MRIASRSTVTASDNQLPCLSTVPPRYLKKKLGKDELNIKKNCLSTADVFVGKKMSNNL